MIRLSRRILLYPLDSYDYVSYHAGGNASVTYYPIHRVVIQQKPKQVMVKHSPSSLLRVDLDRRDLFDSCLQGLLMHSDRRQIALSKQFLNRQLPHM